MLLKCACPCAEDEDDAGEDDVPKEAPKKDPFAHLPKSTMVIDEWKRTYSNSPFKEDQSRDYFQAMPRFWEMLDKAGYTLWHQLYKYNADASLKSICSGEIRRTEHFSPSCAEQGELDDVESCLWLPGTDRGDA
jgi:hypothetical protein